VNDPTPSARGAGLRSVLGRARGNVGVKEVRGLSATLLALLLALALVACCPEAWERDPQVQKAKRACKELDEGERYACIERHAVETLNPDVCRLAGIWIDDMCLQAVYEAAGDPAICEQIYLEGVRPTCRAYYAAWSAPPQTPLPSEPLPAFLLQVFPEAAAVLSLEEYTDPAWRPGRPSSQEVPLSVCVEVEASSLLERGDFWEATTIQERTAVRVDGRRQELITAFVDHMLLHTIVDPADDPSGTVVASVGGPYHFCFYVPLTADVHRVDVSFKKSTGEVVSYAWTFELFDGPRPLHTPLPAAEATPADQGVPASIWKLILFSYNHNGATELWTIDPASGETQRQIQPEQTVQDPALSPSGETIAYVRVTGDYGGVVSELWLMDRDGANPRPLYVPPADQSVLSLPAWSPDGQEVYFLQLGSGADSQLLRIPVTGGEPAVVLSDCIDFALSPDGDWLISVSLGRQLTVSRGDGTQPRDLEPQGTAFADYYSLAASPDGSLLSFRAAEAAGEDTWNLYVMDWSGREIRRLTDLIGFHPFSQSSGQVNGLAWTADGMHMVYSVDGHPEQSGIWRIGLDGGEPRRLFAWEEGEWASIQGPWFEPSD
jgi:Tol biopolymer transport system component